jgi:hypothetical protein
MHIDQHGMDTNGRFTIDGSDELEARLRGLCSEVSDEIRAIVPPKRLQAIVLGGGYGRGEGGVLRTANRDEPYNDIEFYVFVQGNRHWNCRQYGGALCRIAEALSAENKLHVEFKTDSLERLRRASITMFTYDLVSAHRIVFQTEPAFAGCSHHLQSADLPLREATRLLFNRCSGLLLVRELLQHEQLSSEETDFIRRNIAKVQLALGDALLVASAAYHWSVVERARRMRDEAPDSQFQALETLRIPNFEMTWDQVKRYHSLGAEFKIHPSPPQGSREELTAEYRLVSAIGSQLWLALENRRLNRSFGSIRDYALSRTDKCPETFAWRNLLCNVRTFGPAAALDGMGGRYPRERLFNSLPLLLWNGEVDREPEVQRHLRTQLRSRAGDWNGFVADYKKAWPPYG